MTAPQDADGWVAPIVRQYLQTSASGFPYITCPDELRPRFASVDSWYVIYAPTHYCGAVVDGYLVDAWSEQQRKWVAIWSLLGVLVPPLALAALVQGSWLIAIALAVGWLALLPAAAWLRARSIFARY